MLLVRRILLATMGLVLLCFLVFESIHQANKPKLYKPPKREPAGGPLPGKGGQARLQRSEARWFKDVSDEVKLDFVQAVGPLGSYFMPEINGSGGALLDYDNDGDLDLFLVNLGKSPKAPREFPAGTNLSHRLYRRSDSGQFDDVTASTGLSVPSANDGRLGIGCAVGDVNNDGYQDLYLTNYGPDQLFLNRNADHFEDCTGQAELGCADWGTAAAFFDYDRDGWLDLIVVNYASDPDRGHTIACGFTKDTVSYCGPHKFQPTIDRLYHNEGMASMVDGVPKFRDVTDSAGLGKTNTYGLGLAISDFDGDGWPDVFIASDMRENRLWMNQRNGTFLEEALPRGCAVSGEGIMQGCMGVAVGDVDRDGDFDLAITNLVTEGSTLYINDGKGSFRDESMQTRLLPLTNKHTGWGVALIDLDHDGDLDIPMVNGYVVPNRSMFPPHGEDKFQEYVEDVKNPLEFVARYNDRNILLFSDEKRAFRDQSAEAGDFTFDDVCARGLIYGDVDQDGDLDLVTTSVGGRARLFRNDVPKKGNWLSVRCWLPDLKRDALGAVVKVVAKEHTWTSQCTPSTSYLASNEPVAHFGLGAVDRYDQIEVMWPDGQREVFPGSSANQKLNLHQGKGSHESTTLESSRSSGAP